MLDLSYLRENLNEARHRLLHRGFALDVVTFERLDGERKNLIIETDRLRALRNTASDEIARLVKAKADVTDKRNEMKAVSQRIGELEKSLGPVEEELKQFAANIPNLPDPDVPIGLTEDENVE